MRTFAQKSKAAQQRTSAKSTKPVRAHFGRHYEVNSILHLQRTIGNQAVQRLLRGNDQKVTSTGATLSPSLAHNFSQIQIYSPAPASMQTKRTEQTADDKYEQEADRVADQVMRKSKAHPEHTRAGGGWGPSYRKEQQGKEHMILQINRVQPGDAVGKVTPPNIGDIFRTPSQPLPHNTRGFFESRLGHDFSQVRVHTSGGVGEEVHALGALACTMGNDIAFGRGQYAPDTSRGSWLLAHELTHVVQQTRGRTSAALLTPHEQEGDRAANVAMASPPGSVSAGTIQVGTPQFKDDTTVIHPGAQPTPEEYIKSHTNYWGLNLQEEKLASDLFLLAWQSRSHYDFVLRVFKALDSSNQMEVAETFFKQIKSDSWIKDIALTTTGRSFLTSITTYLPERHHQRDRVAEIVEAELQKPQAEREKERRKALEELKNKGKNVDITFYPEYEGMDSTEQVLGIVARRRKSEKKTAAFPMEQFLDIPQNLEAVSKAYGGATDFVRELHLMGHGTEDNFGFGRHYYDSAFLKKTYPTGLIATYMTNGGTIYMEGCDVAKGEAGRAYLRQIGRIFFGDKKTGYIKGNTCTALVMGEVIECGAKTFRWPSDFK